MDFGIELSKNIKSSYLDEEENLPTVFLTCGYEKEKKDGKKLINGIFEIKEKIGEGSFWTVFKVQRVVYEDDKEIKSIYVFKEGKLNFSLPNDDFLINAKHGNESELIPIQALPLFENIDELDLLPNSSNNFEESDFEIKYSDKKIINDERLGLKELFILRKINNRNIARLYECIIDEELDKIVFVMENCDLGQLMKYNEESTGYEYNSSLIKFLFSQLFIENVGDQREIILSIIKYKANDNLIIIIDDFLLKLEELNQQTENKDKIKEQIENFIYEMFEKNIKLRIYLTRIIFRQIIQGVKYLHGKNICNRDIKPENIVCKNTFWEKEIQNKENVMELNKNEIPDNFVKLIDFSISKIYKDKDEKIFTSVGSDLFKSPEMLNFDYFNPFKAEIYSIGVTIIFFIFKKFYKPQSIKQFKEEDKLIKIEEIKNKTTNNINMTFKRDNSKLMIMKSNSLLLRPRKSSMIYTNYENLEKKEFIGHINEIKSLFESADEIFLFDLLQKIVADNPEERLEIDQIENDIFFI